MALAQRPFELLKEKIDSFIHISSRNNGIVALI